MANVLATRAEIKVLQVLVKADECYGLQIVKRSRGKISRSGVYTLLNRLYDKGFVKRRYGNDGHAGLPRPLYSLTDLGHRMLGAWAILTSSHVGKSAEPTK